jgi:hypothetical protein
MTVKSHRKAGPRRSNALIRIEGRFPYVRRERHHCDTAAKHLYSGKAGTLPLPVEMGWRPTVATIRMPSHLFSAIAGDNGFT